MNRDIPKPSKRNRLVKNRNKIRRSRIKKKIKHTSSRYNRNLKTPNIMNMGDYLDFTKLKKFQPIDSSDVSNVKLTSNWYWSNYKKALEWQDRHKIAHWKACALALQEENRYLMEIIQSFQQGMFPVSTNPVQGRRKSRSKTCTKSKSEDNHKQNKKYIKTQNEFDKTDDEEIEFEMSEEMVKFFEESFKKKMDLKKQKEEQESRNDADEQVKKIQLNKLKRLEEMKLLYGEEASKIIGMETAIQLSFDRYCDTKSPKYWPNIPLRL